MTRDEILKQIDEKFPKKSESIGLSQQQASKFLGVSPTTLDRYRKDGTAPECIKISDSRYVYTKTGIADYIVNLLKNQIKERQANEKANI